MNKSTVVESGGHFDTGRLAMGRSTNREHKSALGQFLTPYPIAQFMASLFSKRDFGSCRLIDPGAGLGALTAAFIDRWKRGQILADNLSVTAFEIDDRLRDRLSETIAEHWQHDGLTFQLLGGDFIEDASLSLLGFRKDRFSFTHAILNPPYKKISTDSKHRQYLRKAGIETVNLYSGFLGLVIRLMDAGGEIVAIIPRSFCNGPYYKPFREILLAETAIRHIHLFNSRNSAFKDDAVLQENVILLLEKQGAQRDVTVSTSTDHTFADIGFYEAPFSTIVQNGDSELFIHIPTSPGQSEIELSSSISHSLSDIGIQVSTGPVVDFRVRGQLRAASEPGSVPLIYPGHFIGQRAVWPRMDHKKPNAIMVDSETERSIYPSGFYTVVRRFSSKEEDRRIVAHTVLPEDFAFSALGFENHLNVFHEDKRGLDEYLARGLTTFLNSTAVDAHFRRFNGHTQVNATDLRSMKYPSTEWLIKLGKWSQAHQTRTQGELDDEVRKIA
ncbi:MAG TPA: Eco57I restriction-modification methylase domain-containing protein [Terracidiphilus sp.]